MDNDLLQIIESVGLSQKEAGVYLALLELSQGNVNQIAKISGFKRPTIYVILEKLIKEGLVSELPGKKINQYQAQDPSVILAEKRTTLKNFTEILPLLQTLHNKGKGRPKIRYIETKEGILKVYEEMNYSKKPFFISSYAAVEKSFPGLINYWVKNYEKGIYKFEGRHLIPDNLEEIKIGRRFKKINQKVKIFTGVNNYSMDFTLYDNKLALTSLGEQPFLVLFESEEIVNSMKPIFETAWKAGKPI